MLDDRNSVTPDRRNLSEVFRELQEIQRNPQKQIEYQKAYEKANKTKSRINTDVHRISGKGIKLSNLIIASIVILLVIIAVFPKNTSFVESYAKEEPQVEAFEANNFEINRKALNMQKIISENSSFEKVKEQVVEERAIEFEITTKSNPSLPKGEQIVLQEGANGKENVSLVKTYENGEFIEEIILTKERIQDPVPKILDIGTSDFLAKLHIHIGDIVYLTSTTTLRETPEKEGKELAEIKQNLDVKLLELSSEEWCKVSFDSLEGYLPTSSLTSAYVTPSMPEKNRIQRILLKVNIEMELNKTSGLTLKDYKKIFTGIPNDKNKVFEDNAEVFYNLEKKYNINGIFLASMGIHESAWATSQISIDKKNLFGYGAYDSTPYESSYEFETYAEGIELVAKSLVKYYLNPSGTKIYDGETAAAWYYNGPTLAGVNTRYASDKDWHKKVYSYMEMLYNRL